MAETRDGSTGARLSHHHHRKHIREWALIRITMQDCYHGTVGVVGITCTQKTHLFLTRFAKTWHFPHFSNILYISGCHISIIRCGTGMILDTIQVLTFNQSQPKLEVCSYSCLHFCDALLGSTTIFGKLPCLISFLDYCCSNACINHPCFILIVHSV